MNLLILLIYCPNPGVHFNVYATKPLHGIEKPEMPTYGIFDEEDVDEDGGSNND